MKPSCGQCVHFKNGPAHPKFSTICSTLGTRSYAEAPDCFSPDPAIIAKADVEVSEVGRLLRHLSAEQMVVIGHLMQQAADLHEHNLKFGQPVYVQIGVAKDGKDYLTSYFKGYVLGATLVKVSSKNYVPHIYLGSNLTLDEEARPEHRSLLRMLPSSILTKAQFQKKSQDLKAAGRLESKDTGWKMPFKEWLKAGGPQPPAEIKGVYEPPTLDTAPSSWLEPFSVDELESVKVISRRAKREKRADTPEEIRVKQQKREEARSKLKMHTDENGVTTVSWAGDSVKEWPPVSMPEVKR